MANYQHIFLEGNVKSEKFRSPSSGGGNPNTPPRNRASHSDKLLKQFESIQQEKNQLEQQRTALHISTKKGSYISFFSAANHDLVTMSLEDLGKDIRLLNIQEIPIDQNQIRTQATVYVPKGKERIFMEKVSAYSKINTTTIKYKDNVDDDEIRQAIKELGNGISIKKIRTPRSRQFQKEVTILLPGGQEQYFTNRIKDKFPEATIKITPKNKKLVESIEDVRLAVLESFWTGDKTCIPNENAKWCEAWLNVNTKESKEEGQIQQFIKVLENIGIEVKRNDDKVRVIIFPERAVLLINANRSQLVELMMQSELLAEFRAGQEHAGFWVNQTSHEQQDWVEDLLNRIDIIESNVKVCLLDSGVNNGHQLLEPLLEHADTLSAETEWGTNDHEPGTGHGTLMAGLAGYGTIERILTSGSQVPLTHKLCSVKVVPRPEQEQTPIELWGEVTSRAISKAEIQNPKMNLVYCMSLTSTTDVDRGRPSSWSGAVDQLAFGEGDDQRLIVISAGNVKGDENWKNYPDSNFASSIQNPAQSWNSIVAGAYTDKIQISDPTFDNHTPIANEGELSPFSSTSQVWGIKWPIKPDVVFEGGNLLKAPDNTITGHEDLELLSTSKAISIKSFSTFNATSAAAAQASWFAAKIAYHYPNAWPETIRGLMIHSAGWNLAMKNQLKIQENKKTSMLQLLRTFGFGIPDLDKALYSYESALTFIAQEIIQPFSYKEDRPNAPETNEIHFYNLPWPKELLLGLENTEVKLRVTLSYFVEPGPGQVGWKDRYRYQSHGLRFDVNNRGETEEEFRKRVNKAAREEDEKPTSSGGSDRWAIGKENRSKGSVHSDFWEGSASDLSTCHHIAVYPVIGWWRERKHLKKVETKTRYSLIISLETPAEEVEFYTTVKNMIEVPVEIRSE